MGLSYEVLLEALRGERLPAALVDLDAFDANVDVHLDLIRDRGTPLRPASKSIRVVALLKRVMERAGGAFRGVLCFAIPEAAFLASRGFDDFLVAYPEYREGQLRQAARMTAEGLSIAVTTDSAAGVERIGSVAVQEGVELKVVLDIDMSLKLFGGGVHLGVRRSPVHEAEDVLALARVVEKTAGVRLHGLLCYEAQIAGLQDANPYQSWMNSPKAFVKRRSISEVRTRRAAIVEHLRRHDLQLALVNGGGVGSLDSTTPETGVTEITAGSGFYKPHLFDYYRAPHMERLKPAAFFALEVTRHPTPRMVTCLGGGYIASGPPGWDKTPRPWLPEGLTLSKDEGCGEVQTPLSVPAGVALSLGDPVFFRHAKGGELMERFQEVLLVQGGKIVDRVPTYRGEGTCFL